MVIFDFAVNYGLVVWNGFPRGHDIVKNEENITFEISPQSLVGGNWFIFILAQDRWLLSQDNIDFFLITDLIFVYHVGL